MREPIPEALAGERIDRVVSMLVDVSRSAAATAIADGLVQVDGQTIRTRSRRVRVGEVIDVDASIGIKTEPIRPDPTTPLELLFVDDDVIVVDKAPGSVVHPGAGHESGTIVQALLARFPEIISVGDPARPGIVHRLDKGTSGVFAVARSDRAYESLTDQLRERTVSRRYVTVAWGRPSAERGLVDAPIGRAIRDPTRMTVQEGGKPARTTYEVLASWEDPAVSLLSCRLETGRTHQIRVHLEAIGHPVVGDGRYGGGRAGLDFDRPALHALDLGFEHPGTGEWLEFRSPLPPDLDGLVVGLGSPNHGDLGEFDV
ncbi:MAG: RluA family pseudouridine synthase [Acidimicrobiales bacterium]